MTTMIQSNFQNNGVPATGLTPAITIYDLSDNSVVVNASAMSEVANGIYKYSFTTYDVTKEYAIYVDGGATLDNTDRYQYSSNANEGTDTFIETAVWDAQSSAHVGTGTFGKELVDIGTTVDALPTTATITSSVWDSLASSYTVAGSFGEKVGRKLLTVGKFLGLK